MEVDGGYLDYIESFVIGNCNIDNLGGPAKKGIKMKRKEGRKMFIRKIVQLEIILLNH